MLNDISTILGIIGVTLREIAQLLRETREDYVTKKDCNRLYNCLMDRMKDKDD